MSKSPLRILSLSCVYPTPADPGHGLFIRRRLQEVAKLAEVRVVAPLPFLDYGNPEGRWLDMHGVERERQDGQVRVYHPRWFYPPLGGWTNAWWLNWNLGGWLERLRRRFPFDVIDAHHGHPDGVGAMLLARRFGCPFTVTLRGNESKQASGGKLRETLARAMRSAGRVISVSENLRRLAIELGAAPERARTIPNGVESEVFYPRDRARARARFGLPDGVPVVLSAGSFCERKGHHRVAEALAGTQRVVLAIAGGPSREGNYEREIRAAAAHVPGGAVFLGHLKPDELAEAMTAADVFCLASRQEGWPNVVHEAMACGAPVVATAVGGLREMVPDERYGRVVEFGDAAALREGLEWALARQWDRAAITALAHSRSWVQVAREVVDEMEALIGESKG